jgi:polar amino acid transport system substrate-binding protein
MASGWLFGSAFAGASEGVQISGPERTATRPDILRVTRPTNADQKSTAYVWQLVSAAYKSLDITLAAVDVPLARMYIMADQGSADAALAGVAEQIEPRYTNLVRVPVPVFDSRYHIYGFDTDQRINSWGDLGNNTIAAIRGFDTIKQHLPQEQIVWVNSAAQLLGLLEQKRVYYVVGLEKQMAAELAKTVRPASKRIRRLNENALYEVILFHYLAPQHASLKDELAEAIANEIQKRSAIEDQRSDNEPVTVE